MSSGFGHSLFRLQKMQLEVLIIMYETSDNDRKVNRNIYQIQIDPREMRKTFFRLANGHLFTHSLVKESKGEDKLFLFI